jgi:hypothetical protein
MGERSCSIPLVVRLRGVPDQGRLAEMSETIARTVASRLSEAASIITAREGWSSYRETHAPPVVGFSGGSLDTTLQRRVAAAIEAGIARAVSSTSGTVTGSAPTARSVRSQYPTAAAAPGPRLDPQETETNWYLNGISVFKIQRPDTEAESSRLDFQPLLSINDDGTTRLQITVTRDANSTVILQPDAVSQLTRLASQVDIRDVVTALPPQARPLALGAGVSTPTLQPTVSLPQYEPPLSAAARKELRPTVDVGLPETLAAPPSPQSDATAPLPSPALQSGNIEGAQPSRSLDEPIDGRATEWVELKDQPNWTELKRLAVPGDPDTIPQSPDAPSSNERHDLPAATRRAATDNQLQQLAETPWGRGVLEGLFDEPTAGGAPGEEQKQADRIIVFETKTLLTEEEFAAGVERARGPQGIVLPYKETGPTGSDASPIYARRLPGGRVRVHLRHDIFATDYASDRDLRLPPAIGKGVELNETDVVGVKFLDDGVVSFFPALLLMHLENEATRVALAKAGEAFARGLTTRADPEAAEAGGADVIAAERGVDAAIGSRFTSADRITRGLDLAGSRIQAHRGWMIETWPDKGRALVEATEQLIDYARLHGFMQGRSRLVEFGNSLQKGYEEWRATVDAVKSRLSGDEIETTEQIGKETAELLQAINDALQEVPLSLETVPASEHPAKTRSAELGGAPELSHGGV